MDSSLAYPVPEDALVRAAGFVSCEWALDILRP